MSMGGRCPCRKKSETTSYADCCQPYHLSVRTVPTAEALMRSRYAAFAFRHAGYVTMTWHPSTRPAHVDFAVNQDWLSLQIKAAEQSGDTATVAFVARSRIGGASNVLHETSRFVREHGQWFYVDGVMGERRGERRS
jgi:SEC-C motif domain protein